MKSSLLLVLLLLALSPASIHAQEPSTPSQRFVTLRGRVVDARTGEPFAKVRVIASGTDQTATTDDKGAFTLEKLPVGEIDLYITTVNSALVKKTITVKEGENTETVIALSADAAMLTEQVSVTSDAYEPAETNAPSGQTLNKRELQALSSVLLGDPIRAAQALPGATTNDDFRSEFAIRGAGFDRVGLFIDGVLTDNFVHTIQGGYPDTGSLSVINSDTVNSVALLSGASPSKYGNRSAAVLDVETREGNRVKPTGRVVASLSGLSGVVDGPIANGRGAYLFAARKSYVGYLIRKINDTNQFTNNPPVLEFADIQGKGLYDIATHNQIGFSIIYGELKFDRNRDRDQLGVNNVFRGNSANLLVNGHWAYTPDPRLFWQTRVFGLRTTFKNTNRDDAFLENGTRTQYGVRTDVAFLTHNSHRLEAGIYLRSIQVDSLTQRFFLFGGLLDFGSYKESGKEQGYYAQDTWSSERLGLTLTGGGRVEHSGVTGETVFSPRGSVAWAINKDWKIRAGAGRYYQFPDFEQVFGRLGNLALKSERATHSNASVERLFGDRIRLLAEVYDREDRNLFFTLSEPRFTGNFLDFREFPFQNSVNGHARGIELTVQRRSANRFAGWFSYAFARTQLTDARDGLSFVSDTDQRHTVNAYGGYRFNESWNLSGAWRYGSGPPVPGFYRQVGNDFFLTTQRNLTRLPYYSRLDVRLSKAFLFRNWKLTVTGEVINVLNRENVRYAGFFNFASDGFAFGGLDRVLPILPSAGVVIEF
jgi:outer membrane cobalamin receptor